MSMSILKVTFYMLQVKKNLILSIYCQIKINTFKFLMIGSLIIRMNLLRENIGTQYVRIQPRPLT